MSSSSSELFDGANPLQNHLILEKVISHIPASDLGSTRLVCKTWFDFSFKLWRSLVPLKLTFTLTDDFDFKLVIISNNGGKLLSIDEFLNILQLFKEISTKPFQNLHLVGCRFGRCVSKTEDFKNLQNFYTVVGPNLTSVTFEDCIYFNHCDLYKIIYLYCPLLEKLTLIPPTDYMSFSSRFPPDNRKHQTNLKVFKIFSRNIDTDTVMRSLDWHEFFLTFPKVSKLVLKVFKEKCLNHPNHGLLAGLIDGLKKYRNSYPPDRFPPELVVDFGIPYLIKKDCQSYRHLLDLIRLVKVKVERLQFEYSFERILRGRQMGQGEIGEDVVKEVVEFNGSSLKTFCIQMGLNKPGIMETRWNFPFGVEMRKLTELELGSDRFCRSLEFLKLTPNLKKLHINNCSGNSEMEETDLVSNTVGVEEGEMMEDLKLKKLVDFKLEYKVRGEEEMKILTKWIPYPWQVEIPVNDGQFSVICEKWQGLRKLIVRGEELTDIGICGRIGNGSLIGEEDFDLAMALAGCDANWNIGNLKYLEYFAVEENKNLTPQAFEHGLKYSELPKTVDFPKGKKMVFNKA